MLQDWTRSSTSPQVSLLLSNTCLISCLSLPKTLTVPINPHKCHQGAPIGTKAQPPLSSELMGLLKEDADKWKQDRSLLLFLSNLVMRKKLSTISLCTHISEYTHDNSPSWESFFSSPNRIHQNHSKQLLGQEQAALCTNSLSLLILGQLWYCFTRILWWFWK